MILSHKCFKNKKSNSEMKLMKKIYWLSIFTFFLSCVQNPNTEKHQKNRENILNVKDKVVAINFENSMFSSIVQCYLLNNYIIISDLRSSNKLIHIFDRTSFKHIISSIDKGRGPGEITNMGYIFTDEQKNSFLVSDHGKNAVFTYNIDSLILNPLYLPSVFMEMGKRQFPDEYKFINDSLLIGKMIMVSPSSSFNQEICRINPKTGEYKPMKYSHKKIDVKRVSFDASLENNIYVECYNYYDLITICTLDGELKYNIYGKYWNAQDGKKYRYYDDVAFCNDKILVLYADGKDNIYKGNNGELFVGRPTKVLVFEKNGDYVRTLDIGMKINSFCFDQMNNRLIMVTDEDPQFTYLDLKDLV